MSEEGVVMKIKQIKLRPFAGEDMERFAGWLKKEHVSCWYSPAENWLDELKHRNDAYSWIHHFIAEADGVPMGFCQYYDYALGGETWHNGTDISDTYSIDYLIGEEEFLGKKLAPKMIRALEEKIWKETSAQKIIVQPEKENRISRRTLLSAGYCYDEIDDLFVKEKNV